jgi:hypothetical protein
VYRSLQFQKRSQQFIGAYNETLPVAAMRIGNPNRPPLAVQS